MKRTSKHQITIDDNSNIQANNNNGGIETADNIGGIRDVISKTVGYNKIFFKI